MSYKKITTTVIALLFIACVCLTVALVKSNRSSATGDVRSESYVSGVLYQESAEVAAQYKQAFELAKIRLAEAIEENGDSGENLYIVTDIDATLMDDSPYLAGALLAAESRKEEGLAPWNIIDWSGYYSAIASEAMQPVPGAQDFIAYAASQGVKVFYITNRPYYELDLTVQQLYRFGFIDEDTMNAYSGLDNLQDYISYENKEALSDFAEKVESDGRFELGAGYFTLKDDYTIQVEGLDFSSDKAERRNNVEKVIGENGRVVLYMGDSLNDMISNNESLYTDLSEEESASFDRKRGNESRRNAVTDDKWKSKWGTEFIVMPNSAYGDWLKATWFNQSLDQSGEIEAIRNQFEEHSYLNSKTWYDGPSPIGSDVW